jgi:hypothetical protein
MAGMVRTKMSGTIIAAATRQMKRSTRSGRRVRSAIQPQPSGTPRWRMGATASMKEISVPDRPRLRR